MDVIWGGIGKMNGVKEKRFSETVTQEEDISVK